MNSSINKIYFVAGQLHPENIVSLERKRKIINLLTNNFDKVIVLHYPFPRELVVSDTIQLINADRVQFKEIQFIPVSFKEIYESSNRSLSFNLLLSKALSFLLKDNSLLWGASCYRYLKEYCIKGNYVFITGFPFGMLYWITKLKKTKNIEYVLDYRDLWSDNAVHSGSFFPLRGFIRFVEKKAIGGAKVVVTVSNSLAIHLKSINDRGIITTYNFPDKHYLKKITELMNLESNDLTTGYNIAYHGNIYPHNCRMLPIIEAISLLSEEKQKKITLSYYGDSGRFIQEDLVKVNSSLVFFDFGSVSKNDALISLGKYDCFINLISDQDFSSGSNVKGIISTKIFDYLITGKPVINIAAKDSELNMLLEVNCKKNFKSFTASQIELIADFLNSEVTRTRTTSPKKILYDYPEELTWEKNSLSLDDELKDLRH